MLIFKRLKDGGVELGGLGRDNKRIWLISGLMNMLRFIIQIIKCIDYCITVGWLPLGFVVCTYQLFITTLFMTSD